MNSWRAFQAAVARNRRKAVLLTLYGVVTAAVVLGRAWMYREAPTGWVPLARGSAAGIYLNCALVLIPMMRWSLSQRWLDALRPVFPFHKAVEAHQIAGWGILGFSAVHVVSYLGLWGFERAVFEAKVYPSALATGLGLTGAALILAVGTRFRGGARYEGFYYSHFLTIPFGILALVHAPWMVWIAGVPIAAFLADRLWRVFAMAQTARIVEIRVGERDIDLTLERAEAFAYVPGDYAFLCVPGVSRWHWHPFSLTSIPSEPRRLTFRIRQYGAWTRALAQRSAGDLVYVDGPFGSPARDLWGSRRAVVVAAGIGITPYASFLRSVATGAHPPLALRLYWLERDEASFGGFRAEFEALAARFPDQISIRMVVGGSQMDWGRELSQLRADGMDGATLFFCGPPALSGVLQEASRPLGFTFRTESF